MELDKLIHYKIWSDNVYLDYCRALTEDQLRKPLSDYNRSIRSILEHICEVNWWWFEFLTTKQFSNQPDFTTMANKELISCITGYNEKLLIYISKNNLKKKFIMHWDEKDKPVQTTAENVIFNFITHNAYHRGQLAVFLRTLGFDSIKETDFNPFIYEIGQK